MGFTFSELLKTVKKFHTSSYFFAGDISFFMVISKDKNGVFVENSDSNNKEDSELKNESIKSYIFSDDSENESSINNDKVIENNFKINDILESILVECKKKNTLLLDRLIKKDNFNNYEDILNNLIKKEI